MIKKTDFLVIGSGIAGLSYALKVAQFGKVTIITKKKIQKTNTALAQGGVASVFSKIDSFDLHIKDTLDAGDGLCNKEVATLVVKDGPQRIKELVKQIDMGSSKHPVCQTARSPFTPKPILLTLF